MLFFFKKKYSYEAFVCTKRVSKQQTYGLAHGEILWNTHMLLPDLQKDMTPAHQKKEEERNRIW